MWRPARTHRVDLTGRKPRAQRAGLTLHSPARRALLARHGPGTRCGPLLPGSSKVREIGCESNPHGARGTRRPRRRCGGGFHGGGFHGGHGHGWGHGPFWGPRRGPPIWMYIPCCWCCCAGRSSARRRRSKYENQQQAAAEPAVVTATAEPATAEPAAAPSSRTPSREEARREAVFDKGVPEEIAAREMCGLRRGCRPCKAMVLILRMTSSTRARIRAF